MSCLTVKELGEKYHDDIKKLIMPYEYRFFRYGLEFTFLFCYMNEEEDISEYSTYVRLTDSFLMLEKNFYCIVYEGTNTDQAIKAVHNILNHFEKEHEDSEIYINAISIKEQKKPREDIIAHLFESLKRMLSEHKSNVVVVIKRDEEEEIAEEEE